MNDVIELRIEKLIAGGRGCAVHQGERIFIPLTAPGDVVRARIVRRFRGYAEAELVAVLTASPDRVVPRCPVFGACGGCQWQHLRYEAQLHWKREILREQLQRIAKLAAPQVEPTLAAPSPWAYRSRIQLQVDAKGRVGFYRQGSHNVVEFDECAIADARINAQLAAAKITLRDTGQGRQLGVDARQGFTQINREQNARLQAIVAAGVAQHGGGRILELHCGQGNLTFPLAAVATQVMAVDDHAGAIRHAQAQARVQSCTNVTFRCTAAQTALREAQRAGDVYDGIILDPPRRGAAEAIAGLIALRPRWIGYVSCDPATLARDVRALMDDGYQHESSHPIDMFPHTHHIESVTWLTRCQPERGD